MNLGLDIGYSHVKAIRPDAAPIIFPSLVGSPDRARFAVNGTVENIILAPAGLEPKLIGEGAVVHSRFLARREDREWITSDEYGYLIAAAFTQLTTGSPVSLRVVSGLPIAHYEKDKSILRERLSGEHRVEREGRRTQIFRVDEVRVVPQPFGTIMAEGLDERGRIIPGGVTEGNIGIVDVGGKTTNLLRVRRMEEIGHDTTSVDVGAWDCVRTVRDYLASNFQGLENKRDHEIIEVIRSRQVKYFGEPHDLSRPIGDILTQMAGQILAQMSQLWGNGGELDGILITGGGALLLGEMIKPHYKHSRIVPDPVHANARGYYRLSQRQK